MSQHAHFVFFIRNQTSVLILKLFKVLLVGTEWKEKKNISVKVHEYKLTLTQQNGIKGSTNTSKIKGTLIQIWKFPYVDVFIFKQYLENFALFILRILELGICPWSL